ncbi:hypothetical protein BU25DRAFT_405434 [Macroventuria anomochaeta]|uniref:Uncharacterized protein n=1 Tax=Macroventuria anomochaeta TaxID=301207 RepID=A0ACB6SIV2_9PLEO|nr:uncharacterized protein BU25DRAFT_405434 [Macroventuria anomochaeta]KAF2633565.1 hypothetical protein BU25DRAFT_405434 [Macroventuria anomochaeta]
MSRGGHRESLTPMDFEYDNKQGPVDHRSPFMNITNSPARKRPQSQFDSPTKNAFATPNRLRETALNFSQSGAKPLPSLPPHANAWNTPRTPAADYDFSSGGETPNTPAQDSEQATPDTQMAGKMRLLMDSPSPKKTGRRQSLFKRLSNWGSPSPAKESMKEIEKEVSRKHYSEKLENRVAKRRSTRERSDRSKKKRMALRDNEDEESDNEPAQVQKSAPIEPGKMQQTYGASIAGFFHWIEAHPGLPSVLSWYMQFTVNAFLALSFMYIMYLVYSGVRADINIESDKHASEMMVEIAHCVKNYRENRCEPETRVPAMEMVCGNWETCMSRDPQKLAQASVTVKTFARIINSFFEEFSYKSMIFLTIIIFGGFNVSNWAFGLLRQQHAQPQQQQYNDFAPPPQTPHRINSNSYIENGQQAWPTPYQTPYEGRGFIQPAQPPMLQHTQSTPALPSYAQEGAREELKTPSRRRGFR